MRNMFRQWLHDTLARLYPGHRFDVLVPPNPAMGDFSTNIAMVAKANAQEVCDALLKEGTAMIEKCAVAGPGFVNVFLKDSYLQSELLKGPFHIPNEGAGKKVIIEYPSTNIAKPMHVGHSRPAFIGDALARVYEALGYTVVRWDHLGDWGTQFGKLIAQTKKRIAEDGKEFVQQLFLGDTSGTAAIFYRDFIERAKKDPELDEEARKEFKKLEAGDKENTEMWKEIISDSLKQAHQMYQRLGLLPSNKEIGESFYLDRLQALVEDLKARGIAKPSEGAIIIDLEQFGLPVAMIQKSDGASVYLTRDISSLQYRVETEQPVKILYVVGNEQALHLEQLFAVAQLAHLTSAELVHVKYGLILGENGKKLSTREGTAVLLSEVVDKIVAMAAERNPDTAEAIGIGALKYNDLRQHPHSDIVFDWDAMLDLGGNSGPYLQYAYARLASIVAKADAHNVKGDPSQLTHPSERALMRHMLDFGDAVVGCANLHTLNGLALYCAQLAEKSNRFYEQVRVNDDDNAARKAARIELVGAVMSCLKKGLELLGIQVLERI